jgi:hypothetical protein
MEILSVEIGDQTGTAGKPHPRTSEIRGLKILSQIISMVLFLFQLTELRGGGVIVLGWEYLWG